MSSILQQLSITKHALRFITLLTLFACQAFLPAFGIGGPQYISLVPSSGSFALVQNDKASAVVVENSDWPGVIRVASDFQADVERVTGVRPALQHNIASAGSEIVLIGTIGKSPLVDDLVKRGKLDVADLRGKWESAVTTVVEKPFPGVTRALVIAGSDKRGTIFGVYDVSEQIGVSPWYWWADVRTPHHDQLFVLPGRFEQREPAVKYRGIFLNDEAPSLTGWAKEKFGGLNSNFYAHVFELLLRLKANYLWPAMWSNAFNEDDPENPKMADMYGIVMGTSHHEPMLRAQQEWKRHGTGPWDYATNGPELRSFWKEGIERNKDFESTITLGMRGDGDMPMSANNNVALLEGIVRDQRNILNSVSSPVLRSDPQIWALYKEVQSYYEDGMRVPDDVTLLWSDDNWGDIRRLPTPAERTRAGGAGVYYHFDYVGAPRNYKWINTNQIPKIWEQMHLALDYGADKLWIVNVGDLKPMEIPIEFFLTYARSPEAWNAGNLHQFLVDWATRDFGPEHAEEIAEEVEDYTRYNSRRKPEMISPSTFSVTNFDEADRVETQWQELQKRVRALSAILPEAEKASYFELVQYPVEACATVTEMYIAAGKNALAASQRRSDANDYAVLTKRLFDNDARLSDDFNHGLLNGRWDHMMDQVRIGYTSWNDPPKNIMPTVKVTTPPAEPKLGVALGDKTGSTLALGEFDSVGQQTKVLTLFNQGTVPVSYHLRPSAAWVKIGQSEAQRDGSIQKEIAVPISIDWSKAPSGNGTATIEVSDSSAIVSTVSLMTRTQSVTRDSAQGFVESDGYIAIEAAHTSSRTPDGQSQWKEIPGYGRTLSAMTAMPATAPSNVNSSAGMNYTFNTYDSGKFGLEFVLSPTMNFVPGRGLRLAVSIDDGPRIVVDTLEHNTDSDWSKAVSDSVRKVDTSITIPSPGQHALHLWFVDPGIVLERLVLSHAQLPPSYLGPPESFHSPISK